MILRWSLSFQNYWITNLNSIGLSSISDKISRKYRQGSRSRHWLRKILCFSLSQERRESFMRLFSRNNFSWVFMSWGSFWKVGSVQKKSSTSSIYWISWDILNLTFLLKRWHSRRRTEEVKVPLVRKETIQLKWEFQKEWLTRR